MAAQPRVRAMAETSAGVSTAEKAAVTACNAASRACEI
jgi:hypothetical protein